MKKALIIGATSQVGSYLAEHLLSLDYEVYGSIRGQANPKVGWIKSIVPDIKLVYGDLLDYPSLVKLIDSIKPDEVYNLGAVSFVPTSWEQPELTTQTTAVGVTRILEAICTVGGRSRNNPIHFYQSSSSEMFGKVMETPQRETTPFYPRSPYGVAKSFGHYETVCYRESYNLYTVSGICFNMESPRRGNEFVTQKISRAIAGICKRTQTELRLGNIQARRDWQHCKDAVVAMHLMLNNPNGPRDYVIGTGETHSVEEFCKKAFGCVGLDYKKYLISDIPEYNRPADVELLVADPSKIKKELTWKPTISFDSLVQEMVTSALSS